MSKPKQIIIQVDSDKSVYDLQGSKSDKLETTIGAFEDVLDTHFGIDPMVNSLDIVDCIPLED